MEAEITRRSALSMQVCVPKDWTDEQVLDFAEAQNPAGTSNGWFIRKQGDESLSGCDERVQCEKHEGKCHIMLDV